MKKFDWHKDTITKNTQNVRRFFKSICGDHFKFDCDFMQWLKENQGTTMGDAASEWESRQ